MSEAFPLRYRTTRLTIPSCCVVYTDATNSTEGNRIRQDRNQQQKDKKSDCRSYSSLISFECLPRSLLVLTTTHYKQSRAVHDLCFSLSPLSMLKHIATMMTRKQCKPPRIPVLMRCPLRMKSCSLSSSRRRFTRMHYRSRIRKTPSPTSLDCWTSMTAVQPVHLPAVGPQPSFKASTSAGPCSTSRREASVVHSL